jgi:4'-phosphopantetheinyl transferase EntD
LLKENDIQTMLRLGTALERALSDLRPGHAASVVEQIGLEHGLFPGEAALISKAAPRRKREFSTGRRCARRALAALGCELGPLL